MRLKIKSTFSSGQNNGKRLIEIWILLAEMKTKVQKDKLGIGNH